MYVMYDVQYNAVHPEPGWVLHSTEHALDEALDTAISLLTSYPSFDIRIIGPKRDENGNLNEDAILYTLNKKYEYITISKPKE